jgi:serine phosphatase RsbU (regulator of sigma subunit)
MFEQERLARVFGDVSSRPTELIKRLRETVQAHEQGQAAKDDQTLVAARAL